MTPPDPRRSPLPDDHLAFLVARALTILEASPRGASRRDLLGALQMQATHWPALRSALEGTGVVVAHGRGPGLRYAHHSATPGTEPAEAHPTRDRAREALARVLREKGHISSRDAQLATGLGADAVRHLLVELMRAGLVTSEGRKRSTRYRWVG